MNSTKKRKIFPGTLLSAVICVAFLAVSALSIQASANWPYITLSKDGTPISYEVSGHGEPALVFVHGWCCDTRYWKKQVPLFSKSHRVITIDLAGHGHSGSSRTRYTVQAFGEDVKAVTEAVGEKQVILIGHSMGGSVIAAAAALMPNRVIGLIGVDTLENIEHPLTPEEKRMMTSPLEKDFQSGCRQFVSQMMTDTTDPELHEWILADMSAAPHRVAMSALNEYINRYVTGEAATAFKDLPIPIVTVNGDLWPINYEGNRRHMHSFDAIVLKNADHFLMMNRPDDFNKALKEAIQMITDKH